MGTIEITPEALEAMRLFNQYCFPSYWFWGYPERKKAALSILSSGIFEGDELKGHATRQNYPVVRGDTNVLGDLICDLVEKHFGYDVNLPAGQVFHRLEGPLEQEIVREFDDHFRFVAAIARIGGVRKDVIQNKCDEWRKQVSTRAVEGKIPLHWREIMMDEVYPGQGYYPAKKIAYAFADIFLRYVPQALPASIAKWVNIVIESLGRKAVSDSGLRDYVSKEKRRGSQLPEPIKITE